MLEAPLPSPASSWFLRGFGQTARFSARSLREGKESVHIPGATAAIHFIMNKAL
jgi:hypothetical protein